jgi:hypothetical protein
MSHSPKHRRQPVIEIEQVTKSYQMGETEVHALRGVSLTIHAGEYVAIVGASGSGKSTLMNMIGLLDQPTGGSLRLRGTEVSQMSKAELATLRNREIGFIFRSFTLASPPVRLPNWPGKRWNRWGWASGPIIAPKSCRAASNSGSPLPERWSTNPACSWPTSPPERSIPRPATT